MALKFLQAEGDVVEFIDFLYNQNCCIARSGGILEGVLLDKQSCKDALISDLTISMRGVQYWVVANNRSIILDMVSCGRESHPRYLGRIARYPGIISHCYGREKTARGEELLKDIEKYFKQKNYTRKSCQKLGGERSFFGPHYKKLDEQYALQPEPNWLCPGYVRISCPRDCLAVARGRMEQVLGQYPAITPSSPVCKYARDHKENIEVYIGFLCDRRVFGLQELIRLVDHLGDVPGRAIGYNETKHIKADTTYRNRKYLDAKWNAYGFVDDEREYFSTSSD